MFGSLKMAGRSATCWAIWFIGSLGYYVFSLGSVNLGGNQYINLFLAGNVLMCAMFVCATNINIYMCTWFVFSDQNHRLFTLMS